MTKLFQKVMIGTGDNLERETQINLLWCHAFSTVPGPPTSLIFSSPSETEMTLHWTPPAQENGILIGYLLQYKDCMSTCLYQFL